jgi:hypothetical protein
MTAEQTSDDLRPPDVLHPTLNPNDAATYRICAQGAFSPSWLDMLSGEWAIDERPADRPGATTLVGQVLDQAALIGVLEQLYNLGLPLLTIEHLASRARVGESAGLPAY